MRIEFICIIWTTAIIHNTYDCSWGLNLFVLFELMGIHILMMCVLEDWIYLYYLNGIFPYLNFFAVLEDWIYLYYLNINFITVKICNVLEDWIYLYYLNELNQLCTKFRFLRIEFICIIWTHLWNFQTDHCSWGLNLFVLFEHFNALKAKMIVLEDWIYLYYLNHQCPMV